MLTSYPDITIVYNTVEMEVKLGEGIGQMMDSKYFSSHHFIDFSHIHAGTADLPHFIDGEAPAYKDEGH